MSIIKEGDIDTEVLIQETLEDIWDITSKIKKELEIINNLVRDNGDFSTTVIRTNQSLLKIIDKKGISLSTIEEEEKCEDNNINNTSSKSGSDIADPIVSVISRFSNVLGNE